MIAFGEHWVLLDVFNGQSIEEHTLKIDGGTFDKIECSDSYEITLEDEKRQLRSELSF